MFTSLILVVRLSAYTATSWVIYLQSFAICLLYWSYVGCVLVIRLYVTEHVHRPVCY